MQEIQHNYKENDFVKRLVQTVVGVETDNLPHKFEELRQKAYEQHTKLKEKDPEAKVTIKETRNIGRNDPCPCGSNVKFKKCCGSRLKANDSRIKD